MKIIVGLGNPGSKYEKTRHNAGFMALDIFQSAIGASDFVYKKNLKAEISKNKDFILIKPQTFMNESGVAVRTVIDFFKDKVSLPLDENILVLHDDLDIVFGKYKVQKDKAPKVHNGIASIQAHLSLKNFWYGRLGIDGRNGTRSIPGSSYVLQKFSEEEELIFKKIVADQVVPKVLSKLQILTCI